MEAAEQDGVRRRRVAALALAGAEQRGAGDLGGGGDDVACDEDAEDGSGAEPGEDEGGLCVGPVDQAGGADVDGGGDEDGGGDDEEVLDDEGDDVVGVPFGGEGAEGVADDFHEAGEGEGEEVPGVVEDFPGVDQEGEDEEVMAATQRAKLGV